MGKLYEKKIPIYLESKIQKSKEAHQV